MSSEPATAAKDTKDTKDTKDSTAATIGAKKQHLSTLNTQPQLGSYTNHRKRDPSSSEPEIKKMDINDDSIPSREPSDKTADNTTSPLDNNGAIKKIATSSLSVAQRSPVTPDSPVVVSAATADLIEGALSDFDGSDLSDLSSGSSASGSDRELDQDEEEASSDDNASVKSKDNDEDGDESGNGSSVSDDPRPRSKTSQVKRSFAKHTKSRPKRSRRIQSDSSDGDEDKQEPSKRNPGRPPKVKTSPTKSRPTLSPASPVSPTFTAFAKKIGNGPTEPSGMEGIISHASNESPPKKKTKQPDFTNIGKRDRSGRTQLFKYTALGDLETCQKLIEAGAQVNDRDYAEWTPLHEACVTGHEKVAELLIQHHADVNAPGGHMDTPLHDAAQNGHVDVVKLLLAHGANVLAKNAKGVIPIDVTDDKEVMDLLQRRQTLVNMLTGRNQAGQTMLHRACSSGSFANVADLLNQGADIHAQDNAQWTPLHEAALAGHTKVVELLLSRGADPNAQGHGNDTALHDASQNEHEEVVQLLLEYGADPDFKNAKGEKPCDVCEDDSILELLKSGARGTKKPLPRSAGSISSSSSLSSLSSLSSKTSNPSNVAGHRTIKTTERSKRQKEGSTDAHMSDGGRSASEEKPMSRDERKMQQLLSSIRMQEQMEERKKAKKRRPKQISDEDGDDDEEQNGKTSRSSKMNAASSSSSSSVWNLGGRNGKASNSSSRSFPNPGRNGSKRRSSRSEDRDESDSAAERSSKPRRPVQRSVGARSRIDHRYKDAAGRTQLHQWAESGDIEMVGTLLEGGADRDPKDHEGLTPLHLAAKAGNADVLVLLLAYGCNVNAQDQDKTTALHEAVRHHHTEAVRLLLQNNALPSLRDSRKRTSMDLTSSKDTEIRSLITASLEQAELKAKERSKKRLSQMVESQTSPKHKERKTSRNSDSDEPVQSRKKISERKDDDERRGQHSRSSSSSANVAKSSSMPSMSVSRTHSAPSNSSLLTAAAQTASSAPQRKSTMETNGAEALTPLKKQKLHSRHASLTGSGPVSQPADDDTDMRSLGGPSKKRREVDRLSDAYVGKIKIKKEREDDGLHFRTPSLSLKSDELRRVASTPSLSKDSNMNKQGRHASKSSISSTSRPSSALGMVSGSSIASISPPLTETSSSPPPTSLALAAQEQETLKSKKRSSQTFSSPSSYQKFADELKLGGSIHQHSRQRSTSAIPSSRSTLYENVPTTATSSNAETDLARKRAKTSSTTDMTAETTLTSSLTTTTTTTTATTTQVKESTSGDGPLSHSHPPPSSSSSTGEASEGGEHAQGPGRVNGVRIKKEQLEEVVDRHIPSERLVLDAQRYLPLYTVQHSDDDSAGTAGSSTLSSCVVDRQVQLLLGIKPGTLFARYPHLHRRLVTTREKSRLWSPLSSMVSDRCAAAVKLNFEGLPAECQFSSWSNATTAMSRLKEHEKQKFLGCELYFVRLEEIMDVIRQDYGQLNESMMTIMLDIGYDDEELEMEVDVNHAAKEEKDDDGDVNGSVSAKVKLEGEGRKEAKVLMKEVKDEETTESLAVGRGGLAPLFISATNASAPISEPVSAPASLSNPMRTSLPKLMRVPAKMATKAMFKEMQQQYRQP
ncbi:Set3 complex subunit [Mortierella antarctica]|nr:Set3 complex subunit [Mortierella antarctica]